MNAPVNLCMLCLEHDVWSTAYLQYEFSVTPFVLSISENSK